MAEGIIIIEGEGTNGDMHDHVVFELMERGWLDDRRVRFTFELAPPEGFVGPYRVRLTHPAHEHPRIS